MKRAYLNLNVPMLMRMNKRELITLFFHFAIFIGLDRNRTLNQTSVCIKNFREMAAIVFYKGFKFSQSGHLTKTKREIINIFI
jgi:hypothetical protein